MVTTLKRYSEFETRPLRYYWSGTLADPRRHRVEPSAKKRVILLTLLRHRSWRWSRRRTWFFWVLRWRTWGRGCRLFWCGSRHRPFDRCGDWFGTIRKNPCRNSGY